MVPSGRSLPPCRRMPAAGLVAKMAGFDAFAAFFAGGGIKAQPEKGDTGKQPKERADGAYRIAIQAPLPGAHDGHQAEHAGGGQQYRESRGEIIHLNQVRRRTVRRQQVIAPNGGRPCQHIHDAPENAVRVQPIQRQTGQPHHAAGGQQCQHPIPHPRHRPGEFQETLRRQPAADSENNILENPQRADEGTVYAAEQQRKQQQNPQNHDGNGGPAQGPQHGRHQLPPRQGKGIFHPLSAPRHVRHVPRGNVVQKSVCNPNKENDGHRHAEPLQRTDEKGFDD